MKRFYNPVFLDDPKLKEAEGFPSPFFLGLLTGLAIGFALPVTALLLYYMELT